MILLDSDHLTVLRYPESERHAALQARMQASIDPRFATTIVNVEEQMRGWLTLVARFREVHKQIPAYLRLAGLFDFYGRWEVVPFDSPAADRFEMLRKRKVRIGSQDLKIASIALVRDARLLSANLRDFRLVPELRVENWLD